MRLSSRPRYMAVVTFAWLPSARTRSLSSKLAAEQLASLLPPNLPQVFRDACLLGSDSQEVALAGIDGITTMVSKHQARSCFQGRLP